MRAPGLTVVVAACLFAGCSADPSGQEAAAAAGAFVSAAPAQACDLLAPDTRHAIERRSGTACAEALGRLQRPRGSIVEAVEVAGQRSQVRFSGQVVFLARFPDGWLVTDAGCTRSDPDPERPYNCEVEP